MQSEPHVARYATAAITIGAFGGGIATACSLLGVPLGAIVLSEVCGFACLVTFTLLIWGAILDGRQPDRAGAEPSSGVDHDHDRARAAVIAPRPKTGHTRGPIPRPRPAEA